MLRYHSTRRARKFGSTTGGINPARSTPRSKGSANECGSDASCTMNRSEEHTSELQSLMRISYAVFCLKKKIKIKKNLTIQDKKYITNTDLIQKKTSHQ